MSTRSFTLAALGLAANTIAAPLITSSVLSIAPFTVSASACANLATRTDLNTVHLAAYTAACVAARLTVSGSTQTTSAPSSGLSVNAALCATLYDNTSIGSINLQAYVDACVAAHLTINDKTPAKPASAFTITSAFCASIYSNTAINPADLEFYAQACAAAQFATTVVTKTTAAASVLVNAQVCANLYAASALSTAAPALSTAATVSAYAAACAAANLATDVHVRRSIDASAFFNAGLCSSLASYTFLRPAEVKLFASFCASAGFSTSAHVERGLVGGLVAGIGASVQGSLRLRAGVSLAIADVNTCSAAATSIQSALALSFTAFSSTCDSRIGYLIASLKASIAHVETIGTCTAAEGEALYLQLAIFANERLQWLDTIVAHADFWAKASVAASIRKALVSLQTEADLYTNTLITVLPTRSSEVSSIQIALHAKIQTAINACS